MCVRVSVLTARVDSHLHSYVVNVLAFYSLSTSLQSFDGEANRGMFSVNRETRDAIAALDIATQRTIAHQ